jgi:hypothetical protein
MLAMKLTKDANLAFFRDAGAQRMMLQGNNDIRRGALWGLPERRRTSVWPAACTAGRDCYSG